MTALPTPPERKTKRRYKRLLFFLTQDFTTPTFFTRIPFPPTTSLARSTGDGTATVASTTFTVVEGDVTFNLIAHISNDQYTIQDPTPCSGCALAPARRLEGETSGGCKSSADDMCMAAVDGACAEDGYELCTQDVHLMDNELKFSMVVTGWEFKDPSNKLSYGLTIKDKSKGKDNTDGAKKTNNEGSMRELDFEGGNLMYPSTGVITGVVGSADKTSM